MVALYITSVETAGKTALCAGIGKNLASQGKEVGFMMPIRLSEANSSSDCEDATFMKGVLGLPESIERLCPVQLSHNGLRRRLTDELPDFTQNLKQAYAEISKDKDVILMEGLSGLGVDEVTTMANHAIVEALDAKVVIVLRYSPTLNRGEIVKIGRKLQGRLVGIIINFVPESRVDMVNQDTKRLFEEDGIKVLGILPEVRSLLGISVKELAEFLGGEILTGSDKINEIIENVMLGAMTPDSGLDYFSRKANKAAVIRGERADMQLAALENSTKCLILTNNVRPLSAVVNQAEDRHIPVMVVKKDTTGVLADIEEALAKASSHTLQKLQKFENILGSFLDFKALYTGLGL